MLETRWRIRRLGHVVPLPASSPAPLSNSPSLPLNAALVEQEAFSFNVEFKPDEAPERAQTVLKQRIFTRKMRIMLPIMHRRRRRRGLGFFGGVRKTFSVAFLKIFSQRLIQRI